MRVGPGPGPGFPGPATEGPGPRGSPVPGRNAVRTLPRVIDPDSERPVYRQMADDLRGLITSRRVRPGQWLPSSKRLEQEYGVSRETVRRALAVLRQEGLVVTEAGYGTRVRESVERRSVPVPRGASVIARPATPQERAELSLREGESVFLVTIGARERKYPVDGTVLTFS